MIHAYFTNGMINNAEIFLRSLYKTNGDQFPVLLSTRDLTVGQMGDLHCLHPRLEIENETLDMDSLAKRAQVSTKTLWKYRRQVENQYISPKNKVWKLMIAAEDRPRALYDVLQRGGNDYPLLHFDIDTLFRKDISPLLPHAMANECCLLLRPNIQPIKARITISTMTWRKTDNTMKFFERWFHWLDGCPPPFRPIGYGQTSCWFAFEELEKELVYYKLPPEWAYPGGNKPSNFIWTGAVHKLSKKDCAIKFEKEMQAL